MRDSILHELALQSLQGNGKLEDLQPELLVLAVREKITIHEFLRERVLLSAGVPTTDALAALAAKLTVADRILNGRREVHCETSFVRPDSSPKIAA